MQVFFSSPFLRRIHEPNRPTDMSGLVGGMEGVAVTSSTSLDNLVNWIRNNSGDKLRKNWDLLDVERVPNDTGDHIMVSKTVLKKGFKLALPKPCILTQDIVLNSDAGSVFKGLDIYTLFSMFLIWQGRVKDSFWKPYLDVLPRDMDFHPITFLDRIEREKDEELKTALSQYSLLNRALGAQQEKLKKEWKRVKQLITLQKRMQEKGKGARLLPELIGQDAEHLTYEEFRWANSMVISRAFNMLDPRLMCMLPFVDSMNHTTSKPSIKWKNKLIRGAFVMSTFDSVAAAQELTASYHEKPQGSAQGITMANLRCYLMYGFVDDQIPKVPCAWKLEFEAVRELVNERESGKHAPKE